MVWITPLKAMARDIELALTRPVADLDLSTYEAALAGGETGPGIVPGDPDSSQIAVTMAAGGHPGQLSDEELAALVAWIADGAPEN